MASPLRVCLSCFFLVFSSAAHAETKLGLALKQGYEYPYISEIDPKGIGAASGFMKGDHIKEIGAVSIWFTIQAKKFLRFNLKKKQPFTVMVERDGSLQQVIVDANKPRLTFPAVQGADMFSNCYFTPSANCLEGFLNAPEKDHAGVTISRYRFNVMAFHRLGRDDAARDALRQMKDFFYDNPGTVKFHSGTMLEAMELVNQKADQRFADFVYQHTSQKSIVDLLAHAQAFAKYGTPELGQRFLDDALKIAALKPKYLGFNGRRLGETLAAFGDHAKIRSLVTSKAYNSEGKNWIFEGALTYHVGNEDMRSAEIVVNLILNTPRPWTDKDALRFVRLFNKMHFELNKLAMLNRLIKQYDETEGKFYQSAIGARLISALGASGQIHRARKYIERQPGDPLPLMMDLSVHAANSKSAHGIAVQFYKDFPKLLDDTYTLLKSKTPEQRKKINKSTLKDFYGVLAAYLPANPSIRELDGLKFDKYRYGPIIDEMIEVRKYDLALKWTDDVEGRFGKTYKYGNIFSSLGGIAGRADMDKHRQHPQFGKHSNRFHRQLLDRLYWKGRMDEALREFKALDAVNKRSAVRQQLMFVVPCQSCDL